MRKVLIELNSIQSKGIILKYAIGGSVATLFYIEPTVTYDLDVIVNIPKSSTLDPLREIFNWAADNNFPLSGEHIIIHDLPVQFLPAYNDLVSESLKNCVELEFDGVKTNVISPEYLVAIMLQTYRPIDKERALRFIGEYKAIDLNKLEMICKEHNLSEKYNNLIFMQNE